MRSLNVAMRQAFDLYACIRPVSWFEGISTPVKHPENVNMVIFRENTEDVYAGIEYQAGSAEAEKLAAFLRSEFGAKIREASAIGIKPMSAFCSKRLVRRAIRYALDHHLPSVTLVHKGNIMKFTEGGFRAWGYEVAREEFGDVTIPEKEATPENSKGKIIIKDRIADAMFQEALLRPEQYSVLALPKSERRLYLRRSSRLRSAVSVWPPASTCPTLWRCLKPRTVRLPLPRARISPTPAVYCSPALSCWSISVLPPQRTK